MSIVIDTLGDIFLTIGFVVQKVLGAVKWLIGQIKALWDNLIKPILNAIERGWRRNPPPHP